MRRSHRRRLAAILRRSYNDPAYFARAVLGWDVVDCNALTDYQRKVAGMVATFKCVVWVAGNSVGKSRLFACLIAWWLLTRRGSKVIITAPSQHLIGSVIFDELRRLMATSRFPLGGLITLSPKASPQTWVLGPGWQAVGFSTSTVERGSGQHNPMLLVIVDEGSGIPAYTWESIHSLNAAKLVVGGNPLCSEGGMVELWEQSRKPSEAAVPAADRTVSIVTSSTDSPHANRKKSPCGLADSGFLDEIARRFGRGSLYWRLHVELDPETPFPMSSHDQLIPSDWVDRCLTIGTPLGLVNRTLAMSIDVAKGTGRDGTIHCIGDIYGLVRLERSNTISIPDAVDRAVALAEEYGIDQCNIVYDAGGWAGSDFKVYLFKRAYYDCRGYRGNDPGREVRESPLEMRGPHPRTARPRPALRRPSAPAGSVRPGRAGQGLGPADPTRFLDTDGRLLARVASRVDRIEILL